MRSEIESLLPPLWAIDFQSQERVVLRREDGMREPLAYLSIDWAWRSWETGYNMAGPIPRLGRAYEGETWLEDLLLDALASGEKQATERVHRVALLKPRPVLGMNGTEGGGSGSSKKKKAR